MAEPLSFVGSIVAVATLAEVVVAKGYQYLKAVKDCPQDVRRLMAEVNVLCGVLDRLGKLLTTCTLTITIGHPSDKLLRILRALKAKDLKWPLSKSKTLELIGTLERHKATCKMALASTGIAGVHSVLRETRIFNQYLAEIRTKQEEMAKLQLSQEQAYFYVRHNDKASHKPANVLGSLVCQLACQNSDALAEFVGFHAQHYTWGSSASPPPDDELMRILRDLLRYFPETFIMIDGLDECGPPFNPDRTLLIDAIATLNDVKEGSVRTLLFSRDEYDIRQTLTSMNFHTVSVATTSADLRLFANAWLGKLEISSQALKTDIVDTLVDEANGMCVTPLYLFAAQLLICDRGLCAQVDYLQRLPNDAEKRHALGKLPPDLPRTYVRILETIDSSHRGQTPTYIQRLLKWILFTAEGKIPCHYFFGGNPPSLSIEALCEVICLEDDCDWPTVEVVPTKERVLRWLGCLVRVNYQTNSVQFSHFSLEEFLLMNPETLSEFVARHYMVRPEDKYYLVKTCLEYILHSRFKNVGTTQSALEQLLWDNPFYQYVGQRLIDYITDTPDADTICDLSLPKFPTTLSPEIYELWIACTKYQQSTYSDTLGLHMPCPLLFASATGLASQTARLLEEGASPDATGDFRGSLMTPLHLAIIGGRGNLTRIRQAILDHTVEPEFVVVGERGPAITQMLKNAGADLNRQLTLYDNPADSVLTVTPLTLALFCGNWEVANLLLDAGVIWDASAHADSPKDQTDICSFRTYLELYPRYPGYDDKVQDVVEFSNNRDLKQAWADWKNQGSGRRVSKAQVAFDSQRIRVKRDFQDPFINAFTNTRWKEVRDIITEDESLDLNGLDKQGFGAIHYASSQTGAALPMLLEVGVDIELMNREGATALGMASSNSCIENIRLLLEKGSNLEARDEFGSTPLLVAAEKGRLDAVHVLLDAGADINATTYDGWGALHMSLTKYNDCIFTALLERGMECFTPDNYGTTPLHEACDLGLEKQVERLSTLSENAAQDIDADSLIYGTYLYTASQQGFTPIVKMLLHHGATVNKVGPGNLLGPAIMAACSNGHTEAVEVLLKHGAALELEGSKFKSASGTARAFRQENVLKLLEEHERKLEKPETGTVYESETGSPGETSDETTTNAEGTMDSLRLEVSSV
ncbi:MAG: hypothetical protein Q9221_007674 [Calogaya cf. arnoldii]